MKNIPLLGFMLVSSVSSAETVLYEGTNTFHSYQEIKWTLIQKLIPNQPVIVHVGAYTGQDSLRATKIWPEAKIFALEANPGACIEMLKQIAQTNFNIKMHYLAIGDHNGTAPFYLCRGSNGNDISYEHASSLLSPSQDLGIVGPTIEVPCMTLDAWCQHNDIEQIDILKLELEGFELQALQCSPNILKKVKVIWLQTFFSADRMGITNYFSLKDFLYKSNFVVLAHWYLQGGRGNAVYVSKELFDEYFVKGLGLGRGGLQYP
jgi:FkbM family methyltransferase